MRPAVEHPTKRRKTAELPSTKPCRIHTPKKAEEESRPPNRQVKTKYAQDVVAQVEDLPAQEITQEREAVSIEVRTSVQPTKKIKESKAPAKSRRKLQLDDDEVKVLPKPKKKASQSEGLEDTFIFGLKPKKSEPRSKTKENIVEEPIHEEPENAPAPPKRKRTTKAKPPKDEDSREGTIGGPKEGPVAPEGKAQRGKEKHGSRRLANALRKDTEPFEEAILPTTTGAESAKATILQIHHVETDLPKSGPKTARPKVTTKRAAKRNIEEVVENETAAAPEPAAKRPRRQAAISATAKVAIGYEEELVPVDNLRRAPDAKPKRGRPRETVQAQELPVLPPSPPQSVSKPSTEELQAHGEDEVPTAKMGPVGKSRKPGAKSAKIDVMDTERDPVATELPNKVKKSALEDLHHVSETEAPIEQAPPVKRARKVRAQVVAHDVSAGDEPATASRSLDAEETYEFEQKQPRATNAPLSKTSRKAASKTAKPLKIVDEKLAVIKNVSEPPGIVIPEIQKSHDTIKSSDSLAGDQIVPSRSGRRGEPKKKSRRVLAESDINIVRSLPPDDLEIDVKSKPSRQHKFDEAMTNTTDDYANTERNYNKRSGQRNGNPTVEDEDSKRGSGTDPIPNSSIEPIHAKCARKAHPQKSTPTIEPPRDEHVVPRKRHVISADEDLDWLFEKCENKRSRLPARNPCASSKVSRQAPVKKSADAKDIDLDDLLESIAGFSGKLSTGKSGRAMASW